MNRLEYDRFTARERKRPVASCKREVWGKFRLTGRMREGLVVHHRKRKNSLFIIEGRACCSLWEESVAVHHWRKSLLFIMGGRPCGFATLVQLRLCDLFNNRRRCSQPLLLLPTLFYLPALDFSGQSSYKPLYYMTRARLQPPQRFAKHDGFLLILPAISFP